MLEACYALVIEELADQGVGRAKAVEELEQALAEPHPEEVSAEALERARRKRIAEENEAATRRLVAMSGIPMQRREG